MFTPEDQFIVVPVPCLPAEISGDDVDDVEAQLCFLRERIDPKGYEEVLNDKEAGICSASWGPT
jgi:hypothetical protein